MNKSSNSDSDNSNDSYTPKLIGFDTFTLKWLAGWLLPMAAFIFVLVFIVFNIILDNFDGLTRVILAINTATSLISIILFVGRFVPGLKAIRIHISKWSDRLLN